MSHPIEFGRHRRFGPEWGRAAEKQNRQRLQPLARDRRGVPTVGVPTRLGVVDGRSVAEPPPLVNRAAAGPTESEGVAMAKRPETQGELIPLFGPRDPLALELEARAARNVGDRKLAKLIDARVRLEQSESSMESQLGFTSRSLIQCTLPHSDPGKTVFQFRRQDPHSGLALELLGNPSVGLPYGAVSRLFLTYLMTRVVQTKESTVFLGRTWTAAAAELGIDDGAKSLKLLRNHVLRCFYTTFALEQPVAGESRTDPERSIRVRRFQILSAAELPRTTNPDQLAWSPVVHVDATFFRELTDQPVVPFQFDALKNLSGSALAIDLYLLLNFKRFRLDSPCPFTYNELMQRFGSQYAPGPSGRKAFKRHLQRQLANIRAVWPELEVDVVPGGIVLIPGPTHVPPRRLK